MAHNGSCHRLPGFAHFESSLNTVSSPLCSFEQLDLRFGPEDMGLPNTGLDLSCVNGLDLSSASYEGLNLTQQCLNLSSSSSTGQSSRAGSSTGSSNKQQHHQTFQSQPEMVLNLSTQIGLNLSRPSAMGWSSGLEHGMGETFGGGGEGASFHYYGDYSSYSSYPVATSTLCNMEEQRCSPLNLERRSSPLNLAVAPPGVAGGGRKRKPTPGQAQPVNMVGKVQGFSQGQDFTCNNQVYDYRIPNKLSAFYSQQQGQAGSLEPGKRSQVEPKAEPGKGQALTAQDYQAALGVELAHHGGNELFFPELQFQHDHVAIQDNTNFSQDISLSVNNSSRRGVDRAHRNKLTSSLGKLHQSIKEKPSTGKQLANSSQEGGHGLGSQTSSSYTFQDPSYPDLAYSYTDALNFAAEALNVSTTSPHKNFSDYTSQAELHPDKSSCAVKVETNHNDLAACLMNKIRLFCSSCSLEFATSDELNKHMEGHNKAFSQPTYSCNLCKLGFSEESQLLTHNKLQHEGPKVKITDQKPSTASSPQPKNLTVRKAGGCMKSSKEPVKYEPKVISQEEIQKLKEEMAREPFPYQCVTCSKKFAERTELVQHMEDHNAMKPFKCAICDLGFTYMSAKKRHEKTHSNDKPFQCKECMKSFYRKSDLTTHTKTHNKTKQRHSCEQCGQMFTTENQVKEHNCSAKPSKQLKCEVCPSVLATKVEWGVHMWRHTKNSSYIITNENDPLPRLGAAARKIPDLAADKTAWKTGEGNIQPLNMQVLHA